MLCYLTFKISPTYSVKWSELVPVLDTHPAEVKSHPRGDGPADCAQLAPVHCQPVLVRGGAVEVVLQLGGKGSLWLVAVQPTPVLVAAAEQNKCTNQLAKALHATKVPSYSAERHHLLVHNWYVGALNIWRFGVNTKQK